MGEMKAFKSFTEGLIKSFDRHRDAEMGRDGNAVLSYMKAEVEMKDHPHIRVAKFFVKVFGNARLNDYQTFIATKKVADLFPKTSNIDDMRDALNLGIRFLKKGGWKIHYFDDHIEWSFEKIIIKSVRFW